MHVLLITCIKTISSPRDNKIISLYHETLSGDISREKSLPPRNSEAGRGFYCSRGISSQDYFLTFVLFLVDIRQIHCGNLIAATILSKKANICKVSRQKSFYIYMYYVF